MDDAMSESRPRTRHDGLIVTEAGDDLLMYDEPAKQLHCLDAQVRKVWLACNGHRSLATIAVETGLSGDMVRVAVGQLSGLGLFDGPVLDQPERSSRRRLFKQAGVAVVPAIVSLTVPMSVAHASTVCEVYTEVGCYRLLEQGGTGVYCWIPGGLDYESCEAAGAGCNQGGLCTAWCLEGSESCVAFQEQG